MAFVKDRKSFDERVVLKKLSSGSEEAFRAIYDRYHAMIYQAAVRFLQNAVVAEDVVQDVFSSVWERRQELDTVQNFEAYLRTIGKNQIYSFLRKVSYEEKQLAGYAKTLEASVDDCDFALLNQQNEELLNKILDTLPLRQREVFMLARNESLSYYDIAQRLDISQGTVKNHMLRALQAIRQQLAHYLVSLCLLFA